MRSGTREGREPLCPFCKRELDRPTELRLDTLDEVLAGTCKNCGAFYIADPTGKSVGEIMMQALGEAAKHLSKNVSDLVAGEDYEDAILSYNWRIHQSAGVAQGYMDGYGRLYVVKWKPKNS